MDFPDLPAITYTNLQAAQRREILKAQASQFEQEMFGHQANYARFKAQYEATTDEGDKQAFLEAAHEAVKAVTTIQSALATTHEELTKLSQ